MPRPAPGRKPGPSTLTRNVQFFRADAGTGTTGAPVELDLGPTLNHVGTLLCEEGGRYVDQDDGNVVCSWVDSTPRRQRMRLATVRRTGLPLLAEADALSALPLTQRQGLYEAIHVVFFPGGIVGAATNFYGPRPSRLPWYLSRVTAGASPIFNLDPLLRQDVVAQLDRLEQLRIFTLAIRPAFVTAVAQADQSLGAAFSAAAQAGGSQIVEVTLRPESHARGWLAPRLRRTARTLAGRRDLRDNVSAFTVKGLNTDTSRVDQLDLLRDQLIAPKRIIALDARSRAVDDHAAYRAIEEAYAEMRADLETAATAAIATRRRAG